MPEENIDYGKTANYLIIEEACKKIVYEEISDDEFLTTLAWIENLIKNTESKENETIREDEGTETLKYAKKLYREGIQFYKEAILELREYLNNLDEECINNGLSMALQANRKLLDARKITKEKIRQIDGTERLFKQQQILKRNITANIISHINCDIRNTSKPVAGETGEHALGMPEILSAVPIFEMLTKEEREEIFQRIDCKTYKKGTILFNDGDVAREFFIIKSGEIHLYKDFEDDLIHIATLSTGDIFGEMGILTDAPRSLSVRISSENAELYVISCDNFLYILKNYPEVSLKLSRILCNRITENNNRLFEYL